MKFRDTNLLIAEPFPDGFDAHFARVVDLIPETDRRKLLQFWRKDIQPDRPRKHEVRVVDLADVEGCVTERPHLIVFYSRSVLAQRKDDPTYLSELIAHELAHAYDWCEGGCNHDIANDSRPELQILMEEYAIQTASRWNFDLPGKRSHEEHFKLTAKFLLRKFDPLQFPDAARLLTDVVRTGDVLPIKSWNDSRIPLVEK
jgi:hypothetical protein